MTKSTKPPGPTFQPLGDRVLLRRIEQGDVKVGLLHLPQSAKLDAGRGEIIMLGTGGAGPDGKPVAFKLKVGDIVLLPGFPGPTFREDGVRYDVYRESEIIGVFRR